MRKFSRPTHTVGHPPGTLKPKPDKPTEGLCVKLMEYDKSTLDEQKLDRVEDCFTLAARNLCTWIDIDGVPDIAALESLGEHFELHPLLLEDIANEVMKTLTVIATPFIPLTFIAGVYGMNFKHMPELHWRWAYPTLWVFMVGVTIVMLMYFKRKRWF